MAFVPCVAPFVSKASVGFSSSGLFKASPNVAVAAPTVVEKVTVMSSEKSFCSEAPRRNFLASAAALAGLLSVPSAAFAESLRSVEGFGRGAKFGFFEADTAASGTDAPAVYSQDDEVIKEAVERIRKARKGLESANAYARKKFWEDLRADIRGITYDLRHDLKLVSSALSDTDKSKLSDLSKSLYKAMTSADLAAFNANGSEAVKLSEEALDLFDEVFALIPKKFTA
mmetsp:Transcript_1821/g.3466  ORF Transcript_1821/g.3466 Transcript_1821/m.3466 type:complete len:228 (-) Transcript_1821:792-1475(-)|eukprot:CAMPEP_0196653170 /NCGR_PEP_ID=MMETSP1086-20130531/2774_1 /TAXON_ID=77921 /ORGANISM="Cyanoptyche  gloeocystis , Strain SAG4.97" /LENGTH=227 /DNA_ID=CAMNT_0041984233 /DNA_START=108 /DNA_END=791 /DNA_ORIENTATION=-